MKIGIVKDLRAGVERECHRSYGSGNHEERIKD